MEKSIPSVPSNFRWMSVCFVMSLLVIITICLILTVYLRRFFEEPEEDYFFLIDEAHNLVNRSKEMYSAEIRRSTFKDLRKQLPMDQQKLRRALNKVEKEFSAIEKIAETDHWKYHHQKEPHETMNKQLAS